VSYIAQEHGTILILASISLLLLLLFYIIYRRRCIKLNENKLHKQQQQQQHRQSLENNLLISEPFEYRLPTIHALPTIIEENPSILSPSNSYNKFTSLSSSTDTTSSPVVTG
jgi:hypothetical protein